MTEQKSLESLCTIHVFHTAASNNWNISNTIWRKKVQKNAHFQMLIASPLADQIEELSLENKHFNLKTLTSYCMRWTHKSLSSYQICVFSIYHSNKYNEMFFSFSFKLNFLERTDMLVSILSRLNSVSTLNRQMIFIPSISLLFYVTYFMLYRQHIYEWFLL